MTSVVTIICKVILFLSLNIKTLRINDKNDTSFEFRMLCSMQAKLCFVEKKFKELVWHGVFSLYRNLLY